ncbi:MAG TPA: efflux RND transporter periplasmic adaptor subunit [Vicinamibacterales bacterium]|nr:efflux RND transporter periplasmic adaptor subunit [Vicinamibacterales bacterium]
MNLSSVSRAQWLIATVALIAIAGAGGYWLASRNHDAGGQSVAGSERKVLYWHDPMVPGVRFDKPGKSPYMDMQLVPVYADEAMADSGVRIAANVSQNLGIRLGKVERVAFDRGLTAVGSVAFDENQLVVIPARVEGYVTRLFVRTPLERVRRGQPLAEVQAPAWLEAQQEFLALLEAQSEAARALRDAARDRMRVLGVPEATIKRIESERKTHATTTVTSPIDGVVSELGVREGSAFMPGSPLFRLNGMGTVWVNARIPEAHVSLLRPGAKVTASATAWPGKTFEGKVIALLPEVEAQTRTLTARAELANPDAQLAPGMFVSMSFESSKNEPQLAVPTEAVITTGERSVVIVSNGDGSYGVANVTTGEESEGRTAVLTGLSEGQEVVVSGQFLIDSEASLKSTVSRLGTAAPAAEADSADADAKGIHSATGKVTAIDDVSVTLDHSAVASLDWPPMVMGFKKPPSGIPSDLAVGDSVSFTFKKTEDGYQLVNISKTDAASAHQGHQP